MAYFGVADPEALISCPYDKTHMIRNKRMQYHLIDCRKNHASKDMKVCPYNAKHVHPAAEHQFHLVHCIDRNIIDRDIIYGCENNEDQYECVPDKPQGCVDVPPYSNAVAVTNEDWDRDACGAHFNLMEAISFPRSKSSPCFTVPPSAPPVLRQPRDEPEVLGCKDSEARVKDDVMSQLEARRQPRASNASLASLTVRRQFEPLSSISTVSQTQSIDGRSVAGAVCGRSQPAAASTADSYRNGMNQAPGIGRGRAVFMAVTSGRGQVGQSSSTSGSQQQPHNDAAATPGTLSQRINTTVQFQSATVTPAFVLPGLGRGSTSAKPPSPSSLPLPTFG